MSAAFKFLAVAATLCISGAMVAQQRDMGLVVRNSQVQKGEYSFDLVNTTSKPIVGWTMAAAFNDNLQFFEPDSCSFTAHPLPVGGTLRCTLPIAEPSAIQITSVLFSDETATGDLGLLDATIEKHWATYGEWRYWEQRAQELRSGPSPSVISVLRALEREVHEQLPVLPDHDSYSKEADWVRLELSNCLSDGLRQVTEHRASAQQVFDSVLLLAHLREEVEGTLVTMFPRPRQRFSPARVFRSSTRELRKPAHLTVLRFEENDHSLRIVIKNDTTRPISGWGFRVIDESTKGSPHVIKGRGNPLLQPGWIDMLELEPTPEANLHTVVLEATFANADVGIAAQP